MLETDFLVLGRGLAGLAFALKAAKLGRVLIVSKQSGDSTNTAWAQGGIAAVTNNAEDSFASHISDTLVAGAGLCRQSSVENIIRQAPDRIVDLIEWGVDFDKLGSALSLTREGGHTFRRILHHEDQTGKEIFEKLFQRALENPNITIINDWLGVDLITNRHVDPLDMGPVRCLGAYIHNRNTTEVRIVRSKITVLATGGAGKAYLYTSNWSGATGDGIAMSYRAGARVANMEFMQFHPTCLFHSQARNFLISEALRGEGGELINREGNAFMKGLHTLGSLAPRDIVARGIDSEIKSSGAECVFLDMTHKSTEFLQSRFPAIYARCMSFGIDMAKTPIPVVPAAHYLCGGVLTDVNGQTDIQDLWALGETACTGLHGANRLASNSLLECVAMAHNAAVKIQKSNLSQLFGGQIPEWEDKSNLASDEVMVTSHMWDEIRQLMWNYVGIVRSTKRLERAQHRMRNISLELREYYRRYKLTADVIELRNISVVARLTVKCALARKESRGIHYNMDYSWAKADSVGVDTIINHQG